MATLWQDIRYGLRVLAKSPAFSLVAILTLALGIGANTAIFTIVYGVLLRPLPFPHPERIVELAESYKEQSDEMDIDYRALKRLQTYKEPFENIAGYTAVGYNLAVGNAAEHLRGMPVDSSYFSVLGIHPALGRDFTPEDNAGDGQRVAIISHNLWARRFGSDPALIGHNILLNGESFTLVGVMPRDFAAIAIATDLPNSGSADVWTPLALVADTAGSGGNIGVLARLKPNVTPAQLQAQMNIVTQDFRREFPEVVGKELVISFRPYLQMIGAEVRPFLLLLLGSIGFVLLIACANVANLFLARGSLRGREIAVRIAMGASPGRLFQQLLTESMLVALAGGALGLLVAYLGLGSLLALAPVDLPRTSDVHLSGQVFVFTFLISILTGVLFGLAPALEASRTGINEALKEGAGRSSASPGRARLRQLLVVGEFAISVILLAGAGLMIATFSKLLHTDPGFNPHQILSAQFWLIGSNYNSESQIATFDRAIVQRLEAIPGVDAAAVVAAGLPLERGGNEGVRVTNSTEAFSTDYREITPGYFRALGIPLRQGRFFSDSDSETTNNVAIINQAFARKHFPGRNPVGDHIFHGKTVWEIVGVVGDVKSYLDRPAPPTTFIPAAQASYDVSKVFEGWFPRSILVRSSVDPLSLSRSVRDAIAAVDSTVPTGSVRSMEQVLSHSLALRSFMMFLLGLFASLALILASVGIYGVISFAVSQRTREIGVRMALGAHPRDVLRLILGEGLKLVLAGVVLGIIAALALTRLLSTLVYGVSATDPFIFLSVVTLLVAVALAACFVPARRAMRVDPIVALRYE
ncbi:MAG: ABC transporter permease [Candidatus Acidiferrum sp.]